jgi:pimeloyl-ACP methyl ester carboxylesterase
MKKRVKKILKIIGIIAVLLIIGVIIFANVALGSMDESGALSKLDAAGMEYQQNYVDYEGFRINTYQIGDGNLPKALLIHGSPGHWGDWINVLLNPDLLSQMCLIVMDRPGYGNTTMPAIKQLSEQGNVASSVMQYYCDDYQCYAVAGHSYGGGVVEQVLLDHPENISKAIYVAGTLSPEDQPRKWYNYVASMWLVNWMIPGIMRASNVEMMHLQSDLKKNGLRIGDIQQPIVLIQGTEDVLVPYATVDYYKKMKTDGITYVIVEGMNHFIPWSNPELVVDALLKK